MLVVAIEDVVKKYRAEYALNGVDLSLSSGITCVLGRNGAGKSTLAKLVVGTEEPTSGRVRMSLDGTTLSGRERFSNVGWLPQSFGYPSRMSVRDFVAYAAWLKGASRHEMPGLVDRALTTADLIDVADRRLGELSGGMLRRAGLAAAVVHRPGLLVLDEPTAGLDPVQRSEFHRKIQQLGETTSIFLATHLLEDVEALAKTISVLDRGKVVWQGTTNELATAGGSAVVSVDSLRAGLLGMIGGEKS